ncbi:F-box protein At3g07870-like [Salvia hispanica]|uniref:F-box protein At3g07870-like n=1 Tax=Salvia hispanica TaxID=49212 RepID=UPI0020093F6C|nr:F-box protein At3g07870-like [Salvia hispanica]
MEVDYFTNLPSEITTEILSRLSMRSLAISKFVCKSWHDLFDFVKSKIKTPPALVLFYEGARFSKLKTKTKPIWRAMISATIRSQIWRSLTEARSIEGITANGLLLLYSPSVNGICICNLITREYTELGYPDGYTPFHSLQLQFGFGVSKISGQHKVVCNNKNTDCHYVYTVGTRTWRCVEAGAAPGVRFWGQPILCNGNLYWRVFDSRIHIWLCCGFDVEIECFSIFSFPPPIGDGWRNLSVLRDCLCYSYYNGCQDEIVIWMMKEYQVHESWTTEYKMSTSGSDLSFRAT